MSILVYSIQVNHVPDTSTLLVHRYALDLRAGPPRHLTSPAARDDGPPPCFIRPFLFDDGADPRFFSPCSLQRPGGHPVFARPKAGPHRPRPATGPGPAQTRPARRARPRSTARTWLGLQRVPTRGGPCLQAGRRVHASRPSQHTRPPLRFYRCFTPDVHHDI
jgi:hypothetical protein